MGHNGLRQLQILKSALPKLCTLRHYMLILLLHIDVTHKSKPQILDKTLPSLLIFAGRDLERHKN